MSPTDTPAMRTSWPWPATTPGASAKDRKSTRLNSSHVRISYAVFCLKKKKQPPVVLVPVRRQHQHLDPLLAAHDLDHHRRLRGLRPPLPRGAVALHRPVSLAIRRVLI